MDSAPDPASPVPGWYPDPWRLSAYRWWDGTTWTAAVGQPQSDAQDRGRAPVRVVLVVSAVLLSAWAAVWVLVLPLLMLSDADNGRFGRDLATVWLPEIAIGLGAAVACMVMVRAERRRPALWKVLAVPAVAVVVLVVWSAVVLPTGGG